MALLGLQNISMAFGGPLLLDDVTLQIEKDERVCLVGRNGEGKSTLLRIACGELEPNTGELVRQKHLRIGYLPQSVPQDFSGCIADIVGSDQQAQKAISQMDLDPDLTFNELSGGQKRRALMARALANDPDLLVLDEPTNHLDIASIQWMEGFLQRWTGSLLFITHDRAFLRRMATRIVELDRGKLTSWDCSYDKYLQRKESLLDAEEQQNAVFDKKLAQEETWLRKGIKARRTRNEGRVRELKRMREERRARRELSGTVNMKLQTAERSGMKVITAKELSYAWENMPIVNDFTTKIMRGDKIGLIGPNGCGKTTFLNLLLGKLDPQSGSIEHGTKLEIAYFDQHRAQLNVDKTVAWNVAGDNDTISFEGRRRHVISYLEDFLFPPDRSRTPVKALSGGERNRLLLARLFSKPSNVLVLDEPTNDLDMETLELLEDLLVEYPGTLLLVSHDREFLNNVVSSTLVFEGNGLIQEYVGGYDDWLQQRPVTQSPSPKTENIKAHPPKPTSKKLSYKETRELEALPAQIEKLETKLDALHQQMNDPEYYKRPADEIKADAERLEALPVELEKLYERWTELEERKK